MIVAYLDEYGAQRERQVTAEELTQSRTPSQEECMRFLQNMMDVAARERGYDNIMAACSYVTSTVPKFAAEGLACAAWRDAVWTKAYELFALVQNGAMAAPTYEELTALMPPMNWPPEEQ